MRLGVSAWRLYGQRRGIGGYIEYILNYWNPLLDDADRVTVFVHEPFDSVTLKLSSAFSSHVVRPTRPMLSGRTCCCRGPCCDESPLGERCGRTAARLFLRKGGFCPPSAGLLVAPKTAACGRGDYWRRPWAPRRGSGLRFAFNRSLVFRAPPKGTR